MRSLTTCKLAELGGPTLSDRVVGGIELGTTGAFLRASFSLLSCAICDSALESFFCIIQNSTSLAVGVTLMLLGSVIKPSISFAAGSVISVQVNTVGLSHVFIPIFFR